MAAARIAFIRASWITSSMPVRCHGCASRIGLRPKEKSSGFIGYLKRSFWVPFVATQRQAGVLPDKHSANAAVARWLREVANARVHATTEEVPAERLIIEKPELQELPAAYRGRSVRRTLAVPERKHVIGYQHPLSVYDLLFDGSPGEARPDGAVGALPEALA